MLCGIYISIFFWSISILMTFIYLSLHGDANYVFNSQLSLIYFLRSRYSCVLFSAHIGFSGVLDLYDHVSESNHTLIGYIVTDPKFADILDGQVLDCKDNYESFPL